MFCVFFFELKKTFKDFNDFVFVFGSKLLKELNINQALDLGICCVKEMRGKKKAIKEKALAFVKGAPSLFLLFNFTFFPNLFLSYSFSLSLLNSTPHAQ